MLIGVKMEYINHYTNESGHNRKSPRSEVGGEIIDALEKSGMTTPGRYTLDAFDIPGWEVGIKKVGKSWIVDMLKNKERAISFLVSKTLDPVAIAEFEPSVTPEPPYIVVKLIRPTALSFDDMGWVGDFERCLAWALIERG